MTVPNSSNASLSLHEDNPSQIGEGDISFQQNDLLPIDIDPQSLKNDQDLTFFENNSLSISIEKTRHKKQTKFSFLDSLFQIKITPKAEQTNNPLYFKDLLDILDKALKYIMRKLQGYFPDNPNALSFLTLYQDGMVNGLSTGGYSLAEESNELVDRLMQILYNFLLSDENLVVNNGFKIFVDVYSKDHQPKSSKTKILYKGKETADESAVAPKSKNFWSIDPHPKVLKRCQFLVDKCLLIAIILGHLQNLHHEQQLEQSTAPADLKQKPVGRAGRAANKRSKFSYVAAINQKSPNKQRHGLNILFEEVKKFFDYLQERKVSDADVGNLDLVAPVAHDAYSCQLIIFSGLNNEIEYMFPPTYDESLRPIYLLHPYKSNHIFMIKSLSVFFRNAQKVSCFFCKNIYKTLNLNHFCSVRACCLACRRFFTRSHTVPSKIHSKNFCNGDKSLTTFLSTCKVCGVKLLNELCALYHKRHCGSKGNLGYKCQKCNKYFLRNKRFTNVNEFYRLHECGEKLCKTCKCYILSEDNDGHLCQMKKCNFILDSSSLVFLTMEFLYEENTCSNPNIISVLQETEPLSGKFDFFQITDFNKEMETIPNMFDFSYIELGLNAKSSLIFPFKVLKEYKTKIEAIQKSTAESSIEKLIKIISLWTETTIVCRDEDGYIFDALIRAFFNAHIYVKIINRNKKYFALEIEQLKIRVINIVNYLPGSDSEIANLSNLNKQPRFFPTKFNLKSNYHYTGSIPNFDYFEMYSDDKEKLEEKRQYVKNFKDLWSFQNELQLFSKEKLHLLSLSTCLFIKEIVIFQKELSVLVEPNNPNRNKILLPFSNNLCTFYSFIYKLFCGLFLRDEDIYVVKNEYYVPTRKVSQSEYRFCKYLEFKFPQLTLVHSFSNKNGQKYFKDCVPDVYIPSKKCAIFFNGCYFHGHFPSAAPSNQTEKALEHSAPYSLNEICDPCPDQKECQQHSGSAKLATTVNKRINKTYQQLNDEFQLKVKSLLKNNSKEIKTVKVFWECYYNNQIAKSTVHKDFLLTFEKHPLKRLTPRDCSVGSYLQTFAYFWNQKKFCNESFYCCDINSLYPHAAISENYNVGKYVNLIGKELNLINVKENKFYFGNNKLYGTALVTVLPPQTLFCPFLITKVAVPATKNQRGAARGAAKGAARCSKSNNSSKSATKSVLTLCYTCYIRKIQNCTHSDRQRQFFGSYFIEELEFALLLGYKIVAIHECHAYFNQKPIFKNFVSILNYNKIKYSTYLNGKTDEEKKDYCRILNQKMNFQHPFQLHSEDKPNKFRKHLFKLAANSLFGKLQQRKDKIFTKTFLDDDQLEFFIKENKSSIESVQCFEDFVCQISIKPDLKEIGDSLKTNCYLGSQIVANARIFFYKQILKVVESKAKLFYVDTDSIFFSLPKDVPLPIEISDATGDFKHVYPNISDFYCLGPKNYIVAYNEEGISKISTKVRGLNLNAHSLVNILQPNTYRKYLKSFLNNKPQSKKIQQLRTRSIKKKPFTRKTKLEMVTFNNKITSCRYFKKKSSIFTTFPYGYKLPRN